jgi:hypothetical protein
VTRRGWARTGGTVAALLALAVTWATADKAWRDWRWQADRRRSGL